MPANELGLEPSPTILKGAWIFSNIELPAGPNQIRLTVTDGRYKGAQLTLPVHITGVPDKISISLTPQQIPADGRSTADITVTVADAWDVHVPDKTIFTLYVDNGELEAKDLDSKTNGIQLHTQDGKATARIAPQTSIGEITVTAICNSQESVETVTFTTALSPLLLVGLANAQIGHLRTGGPPPSSSDLDESHV